VIVAVNAYLKASRFEVFHICLVYRILLCHQVPGRTEPVLFLDANNRFDISKTHFRFDVVSQDNGPLLPIRPKVYYSLPLPKGDASSVFIQQFRVHEPVSLEYSGTRSMLQELSGFQGNKRAGKVIKFVL
jgi:hypothetical protein